MPNAKQYERCKKKWAENTESYIKEKERINKAVKERYANDEEFRNKCIQYQKDYHQKKKEEIKNIIN
jgi:hypothetical protein